MWRAPEKYSALCTGMVMAGSSALTAAASRMSNATPLARRVAMSAAAASKSCAVA
jgi:hypothetical protein